MFYFFNYLNSFKFTLDGKVCPFNIQSLLTVVVRKVFMKTALSGWCLSLGIYVIYSNFSLSLLFCFFLFSFFAATSIVLYFEKCFSLCLRFGSYVFIHVSVCIPFVVGLPWFTCAFGPHTAVLHCPCM